MDVRENVGRSHADGGQNEQRDEHKLRHAIPPKDNRQSSSKVWNIIPQVFFWGTIILQGFIFDVISTCVSSHAHLS